MLNAIANAFAPKQPLAHPPKGEAPVENSYRWGMERLSANNLVHSLLMATTQAGKTVLMMLAMQDLLVQLRFRENTRAIAYDAKGDLHAIFDGPKYQLTNHVVKANPRLKGSRSWAMYRDINTDQKAQACAAGLPEKKSSESASSSFFDITVKDVAKANMCGLMRKNVPWTLRDLLISLTNEKAMEALLLPDFDTAQTFRLAFRQREETAMDIRSSINNLFNRFASVAALWHAAERERPGFSIDEWSTSNQLLVLPGTTGDGDPIQVITQVLFDQLAIQILDGVDAKYFNPPPRIFGFMDELRLAGYLKRLKELLFLSASRGLRLFLAAQSIEGLRAVFGDDEAYEIVGLCANKAFLLTHSDETAKWMSKQYESQLVLEAEISINLDRSSATRSKTMRRVNRDLVEAIRFMHLGTPQLSGCIEGFFIAPELRDLGRSLYWRRIAAQKLFAPDSGILWQPGSLEHLTPRDPQEQILKPWDRSDIQRLKLPMAVLAAQAEQQSRFSSITFDLFKD